MTASSNQATPDNPVRRYWEALHRRNHAQAIHAARRLKWTDVRLHKHWWPADQEACKVCKANAEQGWIPANQKFQSGDSTPPAHEDCRCILDMIYLPKKEDIQYGRPAQALRFRQTARGHDRRNQTTGY